MDTDPVRIKDDTASVDTVTETILNRAQGVVNPLVQRLKLISQLTVKSVHLSAMVGGEGSAYLMRRAKLSSEVTALNAQIFGIAGIEGEKEAKAYFQEHMQGRVIGTVAGDVHLFGSSFSEMKRGMRKDALKVKLIRHVIEILQSGKCAGRTLPHKERTDELAAFHFFSKSVTVDSLTVKAGVNVGERSDSLLAWGLGHEFNAAWVRREDEKNQTRC